MFYLTKLLVKLFVKDSDNCDNPKVRTAYGNLSGVCGIILNLLLFGGKLFAGIVSASVSVIADALNNLSDAGSSVVTFLGFKLASRPADREHPFGHGRYEYVAGLGISVVILLMGVELIKSSIEKIITPEDKTAFSTLSLAIMIASIFVKLWMYFFNSGLSRKINSTALKAAALDSLTDCIATSVVIIGLLISASTGVQIDGWLGVCVSLFILFTGVSTFRESLSPLLGKAPDAEFVDEIKETVLKNDMIVGIHDLIIHDYGPGRCFISLHAEVPCDEDILEAHDAIDLTEKQLENRYNGFATIHMDPIASNDAFTNELKMKVEEGLCELNPEYSIHDFRIVKGSTHTNVVFDMVIPYGLDLTERQIKQSAIEKIKSIDEKLYPIINVEKSLSD